MDLSAIRGLLFDKDGVLFDFQATWAVWTRDMMRHLAGEDPTTLAGLADALDFDLVTDRFRPGSLAIAGTARDVEQVFVSALPRRDPAQIRTALALGAIEARQQPTTDLAACFGALRDAGYRIGLATNDREAAARAHLVGADCLDLFDFIAGADSGHGAKPGPGMCLAFADRMGLDPADCLMVGDSSHDMQAAQAAGFVRVGVLTGVATRADLTPLSDVVLPSIAELGAWLAQAKPLDAI